MMQDEFSGQLFGIRRMLCIASLQYFSELIAISLQTCTLQIFGFSNYPMMSEFHEVQPLVARAVIAVVWHYVLAISLGFLWQEKIPEDLCDFGFSIFTKPPNSSAIPILKLMV
ncbi:hypothetical protein CRYUN_Cryun26dG0112500 [Craigia yunnanensis]